MKKLTFILFASILFFSCKKETTINQLSTVSDTTKAIVFNQNEKRIIDSLEKISLSTDSSKISARNIGEDCEGYTFQIYELQGDAVFDFSCRASSSSQLVNNPNITRLVFFKDNQPFIDIPFASMAFSVYGSGSSTIISGSGKLLMRPAANLPQGQYKIVVLYDYQVEAQQYSAGYSTSKFTYKRIYSLSSNFVDGIKPLPVLWYSSNTQKNFVYKNSTYHKYAMNESDYSMCQAGYPNNNGQSFYAYPTQVPGSVPVYSYFSIIWNDQILTTTERDTFYKLLTYNKKTVAFYAFNSQIPGTVPIYMYNSSPISGQFNRAYGSGYMPSIPTILINEGIAFYAFSPTN